VLGVTLPIGPGLASSAVNPAPLTVELALRVVKLPVDPEIGVPVKLTAVVAPKLVAPVLVSVVNTPGTGVPPLKKNDLSELSCTRCVVAVGEPKSPTK